MNVPSAPDSLVRVKAIFVPAAVGIRSVTLSLVRGMEKPRSTIGISSAAGRVAAAEGAGGVEAGVPGAGLVDVAGLVVAEGADGAEAGGVEAGGSVATAVLGGVGSTVTAADPVTEAGLSEAAGLAAVVAMADADPAPAAGAGTDSDVAEDAIAVAIGATPEDAAGFAAGTGGCTDGTDATAGGESPVATPVLAMKRLVEIIFGAQYLSLTGESMTPVLGPADTACMMDPSPTKIATWLGAPPTVSKTSTSPVLAWPDATDVPAR